MSRLQQMIWGSQRLLHGAFARGHIERPDRVSPLGHTAFTGWVASAAPAERIHFELDDLAFELFDRPERPDVPRLARFPYVTGWRVVADVPASRRGDVRAARLVVDGRTAVTGHFIFEPSRRAFVGGAADESSRQPERRFHAAAAALPAGSRVLEVGTKRAVAGAATHNRPFFPNVARRDYVMCDIATGDDVDVVADLHALPEAWSGRFDAFVALAVFEHLERPWIAAGEIARILKPGGIALIGTHQCFPLHGYPSDFFRFSREALSLILADAGLVVVEAAYNGRAAIVAPPDLVAPAFHDQWNATWPAYLNVVLFATKPAGGDT